MREHQNNWKLLWQIFITFLKISPVTFGGGYAMIPLIEREVVERRQWIRTRDIADIFAVAESVPGAIAINSATFIGHRLAGVRGAIAAMIGVLIPTFTIVVLLSIFFLQFQDHPKIQAAFISIRATIVALIVYAAYRIGRTALVDKTTMFLIIISAAIMYFTNLHPILLIVGGGLLGILIVFIRSKFGLATNLDPTDSKVKYKYKNYFFGDGI